MYYYKFLLVRLLRSVHSYVRHRPFSSFCYVSTLCFWPHLLNTHRHRKTAFPRCFSFNFPGRAKSSLTFSECGVFPGNME